MYFTICLIYRISIEAVEMTVSVVVPIYNGAKFLPECIDCLSKQEYVDMEVIFVVDSKTTDNSLDMIDSLSGSLQSVRTVIQTDSKRVSGARNLGIREAKGDILWFLDVDDHPLPDFLSSLVGIMEDTGADVVFCNHLQETKRIVPEVPERNYGIKVFTGAEAVSDFTRFPVYPWSRIQRTSIFSGGEAFFYDHLTAEDIEQTIRTLALSEKVAYYNRPLYVYYKIGGSFSFRNRSKEAEAMEETARRTLEFVGEKRPEALNGFRIRLLERVMRQIAFVQYRDFSKAYRSSIAHELLKEVDSKTTEMKVFSLSRMLYYSILYPFTHWIWDGKTGLWDNEV